MGDSERLDDATVGPDSAQATAEAPPATDSRDASSRDASGNDDAPKSRLSLGSDADKDADKVRRSSIRPAPASFRPSKRDPGQLLRPAMVIHAGDVDAVVPLWDNGEPTPSRPSQPCMEAPPRVEPFALADDLARSDPRASLPSAPEPSRPESATEARATETNATETSATETSALAPGATGGDAKLPLKAMPIRSAPPEPGAQRPLHRNTLSHFGAPNRDTRTNGSTDAGSTNAGSTNASSTNASSTNAGSTNAGSTNAGSTNAGSVVEAKDSVATTSPFNEAVVPNPADSVSSSSDASGKGKRRSGGTVAVILSAIVLAGVFVGMMVVRSGTEPALSASTAVAVNPVTEPSAAEPPAAANEPAPAHAVAAPVTSTDESATTATSASSGPAAAATPPEVTSAAAAPPPSTPNVVRVTLDVRPSDAKVIYQGRLQPGPPYEFEVTKGKRMALEVVRFGFATQKVVLDGRKSSVLVGLRRAAGHPTAR